MRRGVFKVSMPENACLSGSIDQIDSEFVEGEATPRFLIKLSIQLHLTGLSLSNTVSILEDSVSNVLVRPLTTGFTRPIYNPMKGETRIRLRSTRP